MTKQPSIWWRLTPFAAVFCILSIPFWAAPSLDFIPLPELPLPIPAYIPLYAILLVTILYLAAFSIWHWRTRYGGRRPFAWCLFFALCAGHFAAFCLPAVAYFFVHILSDLRSKGAYAPTTPSSDPSSFPPLPARYQYAKSSCFVLGWFLIVFGLFCATVTLVAHFMVWNVFEEAIAANVGEEITESVSSSLWVGSQAGKITNLTSFLAAVGCAIGAVLLFTSQRLRWRLLNDDERKDIVGTT